MEYIHSSENSLIKEIKKLKDKKHRIEKKQFIIEGFRFVGEALESTFHVPYVFIGEASTDKWNSFNIGKKVKSGTKVYTVKDSLLKSICSTDTPQGIAAVVENAKLDMRLDEGFYVLVDKVQDPGNLGTIIRTSHAAGALGVILIKGTVDVYNEKTLRSTMGSIFHIPILEDREMEIVNKLKSEGFKFVASSLDTDKNFYDVDLRHKAVICVGSEGNGISQEIYEFSDEKVKIPMPGGAESLNVGIAASIMIFEAVRQKNT